MRALSVLYFLIIITSCSNNSQQVSSVTADTTKNRKEISKPESSSLIPDSLYRLSTIHIPYMVTGLFNEDNVPDTAIIVRHLTTAKDALFIKHGGTNHTFLLLNGKNVGSDFEDFNWVGQFEVITKGTKIWDNVIDGEIVGEDQVPDTRKILLQTDAIFIHEDEGGGGGIIYYKKGKYVWIQQD